jgi:hypothetical protein
MVTIYFYSTQQKEYFLCTPHFFFSAGIIYLILFCSVFSKIYAQLLSVQKSNKIISYNCYSEGGGTNAAFNPSTKGFRLITDKI